MKEGVALITGSSSGIGVELAKVFASNGHRVALVARREDLLFNLSKELTALGYSSPILIPCDLRAPNSVDRIAAALADHGAEVTYLVNNAGCGLFGWASELDRDEQLETIQLNICTLTDLSLRFAECLIRRGGGILNVASIASFLPGPGMAVYYASKAYVLSFSESLHNELGRQGVRVSTLCPGFVPTEFQQRAGIEIGWDSKILYHSAEAVAAAGYRGLMANKRLILPGLALKVVVFLLRLFPRSVILSATGRVQLRRLL